MCKLGSLPSRLYVDVFRNGFSQHGDYVFGWKDDTLQRAMDSRCTGDRCTELKYQDTEEAMKCTVPTAVPEEVDGCESTFLLDRD